MNFESLLQDHAEQRVRETCWFRSAPATVKITLQVRVRGVETRRGQSPMGDVAFGPCLTAEASCGDETRTFCWAIRFGDTNEVDT